ncbi:iron-sulfur cluster carrier protein ApbC [Hydromonas duriensis]|uniref:Iron-sulfur cluster carrier protein n=1 Tax=Hydromonas duriensis TaxID=1527608 RepID=A0A4R6YAM5_9BURK|nr:iron-sulfur cluster carrier protein ApbC [Hydromonas duriensis]TDR32608.1 ATP-binding protein involved in chromosome partitioning [Hydromonas duriensis]
MNEEQLRAALDNLAISADADLTLGQARAIKSISGHVVHLSLPFACASQHEHLRERMSTAAGLALDVRIDVKIEAHVVQAGVSVLPHVKNVIAVASGKGGVGKSTTAVNLALALAYEGARVGLLDADIYGPSVPLLLNVNGKPALNAEEKMIPHARYGIEANSIGFLIDADSPMAWRGPMVSQALQQLFSQTAWDNLDYLIIDMPPGTGDIQLTLAQKIPVTGAVIVTTPQDLALLDARKGLKMFEKTNIPVLGIVENMALHVCSNCGHEEAIFGTGGASKMSEDCHVPLLGRLPLAMDIRVQADKGEPTVAAEPEGIHAQHYRRIARQLSARLAVLPKDLSHKFKVTTA